MNTNTLVRGDVLVRTTSISSIYHHVIYAGYANGYEWVAENQKGIGVRYITLNQFLKEGSLVHVQNNNLNYASQQIVLQRINERIGRRYILKTYNCESFVNDVLTGISNSPQVQKYIDLAKLFVFGACLHNLGKRA